MRVPVTGNPAIDGLTVKLALAALAARAAGTKALTDTLKSNRATFAQYDNRVRWRARRALRTAKRDLTKMHQKMTKTVQNWRLTVQNWSQSAQK